MQLAVPQDNGFIILCKIYITFCYHMQDHMIEVSYSKGDTNENYIQQVLSLSLCVN